MFGDGGLYLRPDLLKSEEAAEVYEELRVAEEEYNEYSQMFH